VIPDINTAIVSRGDNLWRISHRIYGRGVRYTVIYGANQGQIRNPNLIYPGQVFVLPGQEAVQQP
jgi:nucleoid-associated protein YgaU